MAVQILFVDPNSIAGRQGVLANDTLISVNGHPIRDVLDYDFYTTEKNIRLELLRNGAAISLRLRKRDEYDDIGLRFSTYLMDDQRSCKNNCVFCFIDQMPPGMRESLYFKDDDDRLSFLFGNYITLTNLSDAEIDRIIEMHISPVNISVHTTNPTLRAEMMHNRFAGEALKHLYKLASAGVRINCQLVLCPGQNDSAELVRTLEDLTALYPAVDSIACVPVGLTKYREGLPKLTEFTKEGARQVIDIIESFSKRFRAKEGVGLCYPSDEFFLKAQLPIPLAEYYDSFVQLENGVGMLSQLTDEFKAALAELPDEAPEANSDSNANANANLSRSITIATGVAAAPHIKKLVSLVLEKRKNISCRVIAIENDFFGHSITVAGLLTGQDILKRLKGEQLGDELLLSTSMLRREGDIFLDDMTPATLEQALFTPIRFCDNDGYELLSAFLGT